MDGLVSKNTSFFYTCKENYFLGIVPADPESKNKDGYKILVNMAKVYFSAGLYEPIAQYLSEGRYLLQLWSAYLTLEYGEPDEKLRRHCVKIITKIIKRPFSELSEQQIAFFEKYLKERV